MAKSYEVHWSKLVIALLAAAAIALLIGIAIHDAKAVMITFVVMLLAAPALFGIRISRVKALMGF